MLRSTIMYLCAGQQRQHEQMASINYNWPLVVACLLVLLKQLFKLFLNHKPDRVDFLKALATLPMDVSFLIIGLIIKATMNPKSSIGLLASLMIAYFIVSLFSTILWRVCESAVKSSFGKDFLWAFPLNAALTGVTFYLAIQFVG